MSHFNVETEWTRMDSKTRIIIDAQLKVEGTIILDRPPPPCSNPDSPAFSDPGDPGEIEIEVIFTKVGETWWKWRESQVQMMQDDSKFCDHVYALAAESLFDSEADYGDYLYEQKKDDDLLRRWEEEQEDRK